MTAARLPLDVVWPRLIAAADEMAVTLFRTAFSHDVVEVHDMSTGLYDDRGNLIGQTWLGATGHVGVMPVLGKALVRAFPPETIAPGDVFCSNDPWVCNGQTADLFVVMPAFHAGRLVGFSVNSVHHVDIGGRRGSGLSEEVYEEGLIIPLMRLHRAGEPNRELLALIERNVRFSEKVLGDIRAQVAAAWVGAEALTRICREHRLEDLRAVADEIIARTDRGMRAGIAALPRGRFSAEMPVEIGGLDQPARIALALEIGDGTIRADFSGTSGQVRKPVNSPINYTRAYVAVPIKMICDPVLPNNEGTYRALSITAPEACLINPSYPAACFWRLASGMLVSELVFRILAGIAPDRAPADSGSMPTWQFYVNGFRRNGEGFALHQHAFGGQGGRPGADGLPAVSFPYNVRNVSVEWSETETPILFERRELIPGSGGAGRFRGGQGEELAFRFEPGADVDPARPLVLTGSAGRMRYPAAGIAGGLPGSPGRILVNDAPIAPTSSPEVSVRPGDVVRLQTPGGGGHGDPLRATPRPRRSTDAMGASENTNREKGSGTMTKDAHSDSNCISRRRLGGALGAVAVSALAAPPRVGRAQSAVIRLGHVQPITGPSAAYGIRARDGATLALEDVNRGGITLGGATHRLEVTVADMVNDPRQAVTLLRQWATDPEIPAVMGPTNSVGYVPMVPAAGQLRIPLVGNGSGAPIREWNIWSYRVNPVGTAVVSQVVRKVVERERVRRMAVIYDQTQDAQAGDAEGVRNAAREIGYELVAYEAFRANDQDFSPQIAKIRSARPDAIYVAAATGDGVKVVSQIREAGIEKPLITGYGSFHDPVYWDGTRGGLRGCYTWLAQDLNAPTPALKSFLDRYNSRFPQQEATSFSTFGYDAVIALAEALKRADAADRAKLQEALASLDTTTPLGTRITFRNPPDGNNLNPSIVVVRINGRATYEAVA